MKKIALYCIFLIGLATILLSYWFYNETFIDFFFFLAGFLISLIALIAILYYDNLKGRIFWILFLIGFIIIRPTVKDWLIGKSFSAIISKNQSLFDKANNILISKKDNVMFPPVSKTDSVFSITEIDALNKLLNKTQIYYIRKDKTTIFYPTHGAMGRHGGITYFFTTFIPTEYYTHVKGKWYYD